jgi:glycosyltransferase involved in cell wall biosynthesis
VSSERPGSDPIVYPDPLAKIGDIAASAGIGRVQMVAWRDLDHPEAGGSEVHAGNIAQRWAAAGVDLTLTASRPEGPDLAAHRDGYRVCRPAGRYRIFPAVVGRGLAQRLARSPRPDATVEIWNGMPFFSPLWAPHPRLVFLHHVHDRMWDLVLPRHLASIGRLIEERLAPPLYRATPIVTLSQSSKEVIVERLGMDPDRVHVVAPGIDESFTPGAAKSGRPLVVAVGRLVRYKRFDRLVEVLVDLKSRHPGLEAVIAGEGEERTSLQHQIDRRGAGDWLHLPGFVDDDRLVDLYQRAWVAASPSAYEGWGMTITEAAACATPAVVSPITGHTDVVVEGVTGFLAEPGAAMAEALDLLLGDPLLRARMSLAARVRSEQLTWDRTALETMRLLAAQV